MASKHGKMCKTDISASARWGMHTHTYSCGYKHLPATTCGGCKDAGAAVLKCSFGSEPEALAERLDDQMTFS